MNEAFVRLVCPDCSKDWESTPTELPAHDDAFDCPGCDGSRRLAEFARTDHDLATLKAFEA